MLFIFRSWGLCRVSWHLDFYFTCFFAMNFIQLVVGTGYSLFWRWINHFLLSDSSVIESQDLRDISKTYRPIVLNSNGFKYIGSRMDCELHYNLRSVLWCKCSAFFFSESEVFLTCRLFRGVDASFIYYLYSSCSTPFCIHHSDESIYTSKQWSD